MSRFSGTLGLRFFLFISIFYVPETVCTQDVVVHDGGELFLSGTTDAAASPGVRWISSRGATPGFFSVRDDGGVTNYSDRFHIDGYMKKHGNSAFTFPVGNGSDLRVVDMSKPLLPTDAYAVAWMEGDPGTHPDPTLPYAGPHPVDKVQDPIEAVSRLGQWDWLVGEGGNLGSQTTGNGHGIRITASIPDLSQFADKNDLRLVGWNGSRWIDLSGKPSANGSTKNSRVKGTMVAGITAIAIGRVRKTMPGEIEYVEASVVDCKTRLQWKTAYEKAPGIMLVEQRMEDGDFRTIRKLPSKGSPQGRLYTAWIDQPKGSAYYRIRMESPDGHASVSPETSSRISCNERNVLDIYPNPVTAQSNIQARLNTDHNGPALLFIFTSDGRQVASVNVLCKPGVNIFPVRVADLGGGHYVIEIRRPGGDALAASTQFIKQ